MMNLGFINVIANGIKIKKEEKIMPRPFCTDVETKSGKATLKKIVEQIIKKNQRVFDNLAKS
jgi:uncharacterized protein YwgA